MPRLSDITYTGQVILFDYVAQLIPASAPPITHHVFQTLRYGISHASMHSKPPTPDCLTAASLRVRNDLEVGIPLPNELKSRMFMARTSEWEPVIVLSNYPADSRANIKKIAAILPKDRNGLSQINLPYGLTAKQARQYDPLDMLSGENSPYVTAAKILGLQIGEINPFSVMLRAEELGIKIICLYDKRLFQTRDILSTNAGSRQFGIFVENGLDYLELGISIAKPVVIDGKQYSGAIVGDISEKMEVYQQPPALAQLHLTLNAMEKGIRAGWQR